MNDILEAREISKSFPGVQALDGVTLRVRRGEVHAVVGENGAGKSTLMKILAGALPPDRGTIRMNGREITEYTPESARRHGIAIIYQEFNLIPHLTVAENISLGREPRRLGLISRRRQAQTARGVFGELGVEVPIHAPVAGLSVAQRQLVEIAKALSQSAAVLIMDEPTSALSVAERERLFALIRRLRERSITVLYVSHSLEEVTLVSDRVTVLKDGRWAGTRETGRTSREELITSMVGRKLETVFPPKARRVHGEALEVRDLRSPPQVNGVSFSLRGGEILGIYGLVGAGRTELCQALFGARPARGEVLLEGRPARIRHPADGVRRALAYLTEDRKGEGLILGQSIRRNLALPSLGRRQSWGVVNAREERRAAEQIVERLRIKAPSTEIEVVALSGGNQQKVVIGKWLLANPRVLLCDEPTRGVDVGAKMEIYSHLRRLAEEGMAVLFISSELPEVIGMSDRILVMRGGRISAELSGEAATEEAIVARALGAGAPAGPGGPAGSRGAGPGPALAQPTGAPRAGRPIGTAAARGRLLAPERVVFLSLLALLAAGIFSSGTFLSPYNLTSIVRHAAALGIVAMGQAVVMLAGGVDLSVSATITLTTVLSAGIMAGRDAMILPAVLACLATGLLIGTANGLAVAPLRIPPFIATLGMMSIGRGVVLLITHGPIGAIGPGFRHFARGSIGPVPAALILVVLIFALAALVMGRTPYGKHLFAVGASRETARLAGIRVRRVEISSYLVSGLAAVIGGLYLTSRMSVGDPSVGPGFELDSIIAVLIGGVPFGGGRGKISGVVGGVLLLIVLGNLLNMWNLHSWYHQIARAAILILAISIFRKEE